MSTFKLKVLGARYGTRANILTLVTNAENLTQVSYPADVNTTPSSSEAQPPEATQLKSIGQSYSNKRTIESINASHTFVSENTSQMWISSLLNDASLPKAFDISAMHSSEQWRRKDPGGLGGDTFRTLPVLNEFATMEWLNKLGASIGVAHNILKPQVMPVDPDYGWKPSDNIPFRIFNHSGRNKPLSGGLSARKPDLVLFDRDHPYRTAPPSERLDWGPVRALVEVSVQSSHYRSMMTTLLEKAANIFHCQLHRNYVLGLAIFGKGANMLYFFVLVDRGGAISTRPTPIQGFDAMLLARIIFAFIFGSNKLLGMDPNVEIDHVTGAPISVLVDQQRFYIIKEIHISPILYSRGTRVYIVKDDKERFHVLKDSWILLSHAQENSEVKVLKHISAKAKEKLAFHIAEEKMTSDSAEETMASDALNSQVRSYFLRPRFVAGDEEVFNTNTPRSDGLTWVQAYPRVRRRVVDGPIGDPITSYRSRVECLQAFIDIMDGKY